MDNSKTISSASNNLREDALKVMDDIAVAEENVRKTLTDIEQLTINITEGEGPKIDSALQEALRLLDEIKQYNITGNQLDADNNLIKTEELLNDVAKYKTPIDDVLIEIEEIDEDNVVLNDKLDDLLNHTKYSSNQAEKADDLYARNG